MTASRLRVRLWLVCLILGLLALAWGLSSNLSRPGDLSPQIGLTGLITSIASLGGLLVEWSLRIARPRKT